MNWSQAIAQARRELEALIERRITGLFGYTLVSTASSIGEGDAVEGSDDANQLPSQEQRGQRPVTRIDPFGFRSRPPKGVRALWLRLGSSNIVFLGIAPTEKYGPQDLGVGDSAIYSTADGAVIKIDSDGKITIVSSTGQKVTIDGDGDVVVNGGTQKVARVDDSVNAGSVTATTQITGEAIVFQYTTAGGVGPVGGTTMNMTGGKITSGADKFKA